MDRVGAWQLPDEAGWQPWLLRVGVLDFEPGIFQPEQPTTLCVNALLLRGHGETLLVDAGSGPADVLYPGAAALDEALALAGAEPGEIGTLVLTHLDFDHAGGALAGDWPDGLSAAFPHVVLGEVDFDFWRANPGEEPSVSRRLLELYGEGIELAADGSEFRPGLRLVSAPGHREGHCALWIGERLVHAADVLHHVSHFEHPEWDDYYDADPALALTTRCEWLDRLERDGTSVTFSHVPTPGRVGPGRTWIPQCGRVNGRPTRGC